MVCGFFLENVMTNILNVTNLAVGGKWEYEKQTHFELKVSYF